MNNEKSGGSISFFGEARESKKQRKLSEDEDEYLDEDDENDFIEEIQEDE